MPWKNVRRDSNVSVRTKNLVGQRQGLLDSIAAGTGLLVSSSWGAVLGGLASRSHDKVRGMGTAVLYSFRAPTQDAVTFHRIGLLSNFLPLKRCLQDGKGKILWSTVITSRAMYEDRSDGKTHLSRVLIHRGSSTAVTTPRAPGAVGRWAKNNGSYTRYQDIKTSDNNGCIC